MNDDKLAEIRERHERDDADVRNTWSRVSLRLQVHEDRAALLDEVERLREALTDMLSGWRYIRETYGDLAGIGWDRAEQKAQEALEGKR